MSHEQSQRNAAVLLEHRDYLRNLARGLVFDEHRADDLVQQACLALLERPPKRAGSVRSWMARVVQNLAFSMLARERERSWRENLAAVNSTLESNDQAEERMFDEQQLLLTAVRKLRQPYRSAIYLRYYKDLSPTHIAIQEEVSLATVKTRLRRGLELLRAELDVSHGGQRGNWCLALLPLAAPFGAFKFAGAAGATAYLKGILIMKKPIVAILSALALAGVASITMVALEGRDGSKNTSLDRGSAALTGGQDEELLTQDAALLPIGGSAVQAASVDRSELSTGVANRASATEATFKVEGRVVDEDGAPLAQADVRLFENSSSLVFAFSSFGALSGQAPGSGGLSTTTDENGRFQLMVSQAGRMDLAVGADYFAPFRKEIMLQPETAMDVGDLRLDTGAILSGRVVDSAGVGIAGAEIESLGPKSGPQLMLFGSQASHTKVAVSDNNGYFSVMRHTVGPWRLRASSEDHPWAEQSGQTQQGGDVSDAIRIELADGYEISGSVAGLPSDSLDGLVVVALPIQGDLAEGIIVNGSTFGGTLASLGDDGQFRIRGLKDDANYRLRLMLGESLFDRKRRSEDLVARSGDVGVRLIYSTPAALLFRVVDANTGEAIERFDLTRGGFPAGSGHIGPDSNDRNRIHPEGRMRLEDVEGAGALPLHSDTLVIQSVGYEDYSLGNLSMTPGQEVDLGLIRMLPVPVVRVTVRDQVTRMPVAGARVSMAPAQEAVAEQGGSRRFSFSIGTGSKDFAFSDSSEDKTMRGVTDENGVCILTSMPGESVRIKVDEGNHAPYASELLKLSNAADVEHDIGMAEGHTVQILVVDGEGNPQAGIKVKHRAPGPVGDFDPESFITQGPDKSPRTDSDGKLYFENLVSGSHAFSLDEDPFASPFNFGALVPLGAGQDDTAWSDLQVESGAELMLTLVAAPRASISGVVREAGKSLAGARVKLLPGNNAGSGIAFNLPGMGSDGPSAVTDSKGRFELDAVPVDGYRLEISHPSRQMASQVEVHTREGSNHLDVALSVAMIEGRVTDPEGNPLPGLQVTVRENEANEGRGSVRMVAIFMDDTGSAVSIGGDGSAQNVSTDADGYYQLRGVATGKSLVVEAKGSSYAAVQSEPIELRDGETLDGVNLRLRAAGHVDLRMRSADGSASGGYLVSATYRGSVTPAPEAKTSFIGPEGKGSIKDLLVGEWQVTLSVLGGLQSDTSKLAPLPQTVIIEAGKTAVLEFEAE